MNLQLVNLAYFEIAQNGTAHRWWCHFGTPLIGQPAFTSKVHYRGARGVQAVRLKNRRQCL